jgi:hypothetical protein
LTLVSSAGKSYRVPVKQNELLPALAVFLITFTGTSAKALAQISRQEGDHLQSKIDAIAKNGAANPTKPMKTSVRETEVNSYLTFNLNGKIPRGLANPEIHMLENGRLSGRVLVDIDEFKRYHQSNGFMDPLSYISGQVPVTARGTLRTSSGRGQFTLASAELMGFPLPKQILQELVSFFSRTPENPAGFDIDAPFNLPAKTREVVINRSEAVVVQ